MGGRCYKHTRRSDAELIRDVLSSNGAINVLSILFDIRGVKNEFALNQFIYVIVYV